MALTLGRRHAGDRKVARQQYEQKTVSAIVVVKKIKQNKKLK